MKDLWLMTVEELEEQIRRQEAVQDNGYTSLWIKQLRAELSKRQVSEVQCHGAK